MAHAHVEAVNIMYARQHVGVGRITRTRTELRPLVQLDHDLEELVKAGMPPGDAVFHQEVRNKAKQDKQRERQERRARGSPCTSDEEGVSVLGEGGGEQMSY